MTNRSFDEVWASIDNNRVNAAILETGIKDFDFDDATRAVYDSALRWLCDDLRDFDVIGIESKAVYTLPSEEEPLFKAYFDMLVRIKEGCVPQYRPYINKLGIIDWKTTRSVLNAAWRDKLIMSNQWRMYSWLGDADIFMYRGIQRPVTILEPTQFREVGLQITPELREAAREKVLRAAAEIDKKRQEKGPWAATMPAHCFDYGTTCTYITDCDLERKVDTLVQIPTKTLSYSRIKQFYDCPEQYRRAHIDMLSGLDSDHESSYTRLGRAIHAGLAEVYAQAFGVNYILRDDEKDIDK